MTPARGLAALTVLAILAVTVASGPLVGAVDLTTAESEPATPGGGTVDLAVVSLPERATLDRGAFGSGTYHLSVPDATVDVERVTGTPQVRYKLKIPAMGYTRVTTTLLSADDEGRLAVTFESTELPPDEVDRERYRGVLRLVTYDDAGLTTRAERNVTVGVRD